MRIDPEVFEVDEDAAAENATAAAVSAADADAVAAGVGKCCAGATCGVCSPSVPGVSGDISGDSAIKGYCAMMAGALPTGVRRLMGLLDGTKFGSLKSLVGEQVGWEETLLEWELPHSEEVE